MRIREEVQLGPVAEDVAALTAIVRPILTGILFALKRENVQEVGGYENVRLRMLPVLYQAGHGDCGICFEYAVHDAMSRGDARVMERIADAMARCNVRGDGIKSLLFGVEKTGSQQLIATAHMTLTDDSRLLYGTQGRPVNLKKHLNTIAGAFRNRRTRLALPWSIRGLWKADLFVGCPDNGRWLGTSVKINPLHLEGAAGLRIGIVPVRAGQVDRVRRDDDKNLIICPLHHDADFMQAFYEAWRIVQAFIASRAQLPSEAMLPDPAHREVARILVERREFPVVDVVEAIAPFGQPGLLNTRETIVESEDLHGEVETELAIAPISMNQLL